MGSKLFPSKIEKTTILNSQSIRMLQTHVKNDIYNKYCLIHNNIKHSNRMWRTQEPLLWFAYFINYCPYTSVRSVS